MLFAAMAPVTAYAETIFVDGDATYNVVGDGPMRIMDITSPHLPLDLVHVPRFETGEAADRQVALVDGHNYLFVVDSADNTLHVVDVTEPYAPTAVSVVSGWAGDPGDSVVTDLEVIHARDGTYALLAVMIASVDAIQVLDVTDLPNPDPASVIRDGQYGFEGINDISDIETVASERGVFALVAGHGTVAVVDITDQSFPVQVALMDERHGLEGMEQSNFCMIVNCGAAMEMHYSSSGIIDVAVIGSHALVLESDKVHVVDFGDPVSPTMEG